MSTSSKHWIFPQPVLAEHLRHYRDLHPILAQILFNRGFKDPNAALSFLFSKDVTSNPFSMKGMNEAVARINQAIDKQEPIIVYGDFDADGVTSTTLLVQVLKSLGAVVKPYIPHRVDEGYGLNSDALLKLSRSGVKLVITVDCGIRSIKEVEDALAYGLDIIVTDHHSIGPEIPLIPKKRGSVINPKQEDCRYGEDMLAGVGIAYKVADALMRAASQNRRRHLNGLQSVEELLDLVAIGTVADLAPLDRAENRAMVRRGLQIINDARRPGIRALLEVCGLQPGSVNATSIGFALGPRINAAGRLDSAMSAYQLLSAGDVGEALELAEQLQKLNTKRQELTRAAQDLIRDQLDTSSDIPLIFAGDEGFQPGIVGLVAGRLVEEFYRPAVVMEKGSVESRASCRSIPQFDITRALDQCADLLVRHGGHAQAAGFTVVNENIPALVERLTNLAREGLAGQELKPILEIDAEVDVNQLSEDLLYDLQYLEPTGHSNTPPILASKAVYVLESRLVGKEGKHLKLRIARAGKPPLDAIAFGLGEWASRLPGHVDLAYQLEMNEWNGKQTLQLNVQDIRPASTPR
jgi:single-stranded-DNA-specific exonuclease